MFKVTEIYESKHFFSQYMVVNHFIHSNFVTFNDCQCVCFDNSIHKIKIIKEDKVPPDIFNICSCIIRNISSPNPMGFYLRALKKGDYLPPTQVNKVLLEKHEDRSYTFCEMPLTKSERDGVTVYDKEKATKVIDKVGMVLEMDLSDWMWISPIMDDYRYSIVWLRDL